MVATTIGNFDPDMAFNLMGPADLGAHKPVRVMQLYTQVISNIAITILRVLAYVFSQPLWYDNSTARQLIIKYLDTIDRVDYADDIHQKIIDIYEELKLRQWGWSSNVSYAEGLNDIAKTKGIDFEIDLSDEDFSPLDFGRLKDRSLYVINNGQFVSGKTGNMTMFRHKASIEDIKMLSDEEGYDLGPITDLLKDDEMNFRRRNFNITERFGIANSSEIEPEALKLVEYNYKIGYSRSSFPEGFNDDGKPVSEGLLSDLESKSISDHHFHEDYAGIKDPVILFTKAISKVIDSKCGNKANRNKFINAFISDEKLWDVFVKKAFYDLFSQAFVNLSGCHHDVYFNEFISIAYQRPKISFNVNGELSLFFEPDLLSSHDKGLDPEVLCRTIQYLNKTSPDSDLRDLLGLNTSGSRLDNLLHKLIPADKLSKEEKIFSQLLDDVVSQFKLKYFQTVKSLLVNSHDLLVADEPRDLSAYKKSYCEFIKDAKTPHAVFSKSIDFVAQELANQGLIAQDDLISTESERIGVILCQRALFNLLLNAEVIDDFTLRINEHVSLNFANQFVYLQDAANPVEYVCEERSSYNEMCQTDGNPDPIYLTSLISSFKEKTRHLEFLKEYLFASDEVDLYQEKKKMLLENGDKTPKDFENDTAMLSRLDKFKGLFNRLPTNSKVVLREIYKNLNQVALTFYRHVYLSKMLYRDIYNDVLFSDAVLPTVNNTDIINIWGPQEKVRKNIDFDYLPHWMRSDITIKNRENPGLLNAQYKVTQSQVNHLGNHWAIEQQNNILFNGYRCGNCGYGALAQEIWQSRVRGDNIEAYSMGLRQTVANYINGNAEKLASKFLKDREKVCDESSIKKTLSDVKKSELVARARKYANDVRDAVSLLWISDVELDIIANVFGVRIDVFDTSQGTPLRVGIKGATEGILQPNRVYGIEFSGAPIRLKFNGSHFEPIRLK